MSQRYSLITIGIFGITGVLFGAFGAHFLKEILLASGMAATWETAVTYQLIHTVALLAVVLCNASLSVKTSDPFAWTTRFWIVGVLLFSGSLYILALGGPKLFGPVTPLGGLAFILGWVSLIFEARRLPRSI